MAHLTVWPAHAYIPGKTPRHPEGAFDAVRDRALTPTASATASANPAWQAGLDLMEAGFHWEAHEVLEPVWMSAPENTPERFLVQAIIQLANAALKQLMGRPRAARRLTAIARDLLNSAGGPATTVMDLPLGNVAAAITRLEAAVDEGRIEPVRVRPAATDTPE